MLQFLDLDVGGTRTRQGTQCTSRFGIKIKKIPLLGDYAMPIHVLGWLSRLSASIWRDKCCE